MEDEKLQDKNREVKRPRTGEGNFSNAKSDGQGREGFKQREKNSREKRRGKIKILRLRKELIADFVKDLILREFPSHTRTFNVLIPVGLHLITMQIQVTRISIQRFIDPVEHSESCGEPPCFPEDPFFIAVSILVH
uniref:Late blight resistance protein n=1 Tax=Solanum tuberosum TaxID=4113 RepID=M1DXJ4_SOLTU